MIANLAFSSTGAIEAAPARISQTAFRLIMMIAKFDSVTMMTEMSRKKLSYLHSELESSDPLLFGISSYSIRHHIPIPNIQLCKQLNCYVAYTGYIITMRYCDIELDNSVRKKQ